MGWLEGLLGGFTQSKSDYEQRMREEGAQSSAREAKIFEALLNSPDKETRDLATAGLLQSAQPSKRKGGFRGWLGEMESSPYLQQIRNLSPEVANEAPPSAAPSGAPGMIATPPSPSGSLAQSPTAATQVGAPPLTTIAPQPDTREAAAAQMAPQEAPAAAVGQPPASALESPAAPAAASRPRQVFQTEEQATLMRYSAQERGEILGVVSAYEAVGVPHKEAVQRAIDERMRSRGMGAGSGAQSIAGEMPNGVPAFGVFDRARGKYLDPNTGQPLEGFRPRTTTGSTSYGADRNAISMEAGFGGKPYAQQTPEMRTRIGQEVIRRGGEKAGAVASGRGEASADIPLSTSQRFQATTDLSAQWTKAIAGRTEMQRQFGLMQTGLARFDADPIGGSQAVLVTFQKVLDPTSVVRESEYARSAQGLAAMDWLQGMYEKYSAGGVGVPKPILAQMVETARQFLGDANMKSALDNTRQRIYDTATSYQIDPRLVLGVDTPAGTGGAGAPPPTVGAAPPTGGATPPPPAAGGPGAEWTMVNGVLHHNGKPY